MNEETSVRSKVIDKFWIEYMIYVFKTWGIMDRDRHLDEKHFWIWFYEKKLEPEIGVKAAKLEEYLK